MGLVTIVVSTLPHHQRLNDAENQNMLAFVCVPWGWRWAQFTLALWWIDVVMSILVNFGMVFMM